MPELRPEASACSSDSDFEEVGLSVPGGSLTDLEGGRCHGMRRYPALHLPLSAGSTGHLVSSGCHHRYGPLTCKSQQLNTLMPIPPTSLLFPTNQPYFTFPLHVNIENPQSTNGFSISYIFFRATQKCPHH